MKVAVKLNELIWQWQMLPLDRLIFYMVRHHSHCHMGTDCSVCVRACMCAHVCVQIADVLYAPCVWYLHMSLCWSTLSVPRCCVCRLFGSTTTMMESPASHLSPSCWCYSHTSRTDWRCSRMWVLGAGGSEPFWMSFGVNVTLYTLILWRFSQSWLRKHHGIVWPTHT